MKRYVKTAEYKRYNANNRGNNSPDCVCRAISLAFDVSYNSIHRELTQLVKGTMHNYKNIRFYQKVIKNHGGSDFIREEDLILVREWIDKHPDGTYILQTGEKAGVSNHLICVIDGAVYDSWDSRDQFVVGYFIVESVDHNFTDILDHLESLKEEGYKIIYDLASKFIEKYQIGGAFRILKGGGFIKDYTIYYVCHYVTEEARKSYKWTIAVVFTPTTTYEQALKILNNTLKVRMYDRFYAINKELKEKEESLALYRESGYTDDPDPEMNLFMSSQEERFFKSLPGWVKPFVISICVDSPGKYSDSYSLNIKPIKGDPNKSTVHLYSRKSNTLREELERYRNTFEVPGIDYYPEIDYEEEEYI